MRTLTLVTLIGTHRIEEPYDADDLSWVSDAQHLKESRGNHLRADTQEAADEWGRKILAEFNRTLRPGDEVRTFVSALVELPICKYIEKPSEPSLVSTNRPPFKGMKIVKGNVTRLVTDESVDTVWWKNINAKKPKQRQCSQKAWKRWVNGGPHGESAKEMVDDS